MPFGLCLKDFLPVMQCGCVWLSNAFEDAHRYVDRSVCWVELDFSVGHFLFFCFFFFCILGIVTAVVPLPRE